MKNIKHFVLTMLMALVSVTASAYDFEVDGIYYNILSEGDLTCEVTGYNISYSGDVIILSTVTYSDKTFSVTSIGKSAFYGCSSLISVEIPNSVTGIEESAFSGCTSLISIVIPNSVTSIGESAFYGCSSLISILIPNSVTSIGDNAFYGCSSLPVVDNIRYADSYVVKAVDKTCTQYKIKEGTRLIGDNAFNNCSNLTSIEIPNSVTSIGSSAFSGCI